MTVRWATSLSLLLPLSSPPFAFWPSRLPSTVFLPSFPLRLRLQRSCSCAGLTLKSSTFPLSSPSKAYVIGAVSLSLSGPYSLLSFRLFRDSPAFLPFSFALSSLLAFVFSWEERRQFFFPGAATPAAAEATRFSPLSRSCRGFQRWRGLAAAAAALFSPMKKTDGKERPKATFLSGG